jgi:hypothetical protein
MDIWTIGLEITAWPHADLVDVCWLWTFGCRKLIDQRQEARSAPPRSRSSKHGYDAGPEPDARSLVQPEPTARPLFSWYFQPLTTPDPLNAITADLPTRLGQQRCDPTIAMPLVSASSSARTMVVYRCVPMGAGRRSGRRDVRTNHTSPECLQQPAGAAWAYKSSRGNSA